MAPASLNERLRKFAQGLPRDAPGHFAPLSIVMGEAAQWGFGVRTDTVVPFAGRIRLIHWIVSPYLDVPHGVVEDCQSSRLAAVSGTGEGALLFLPEGQAIPRPPNRSDCRNLLSGRYFMGLRGWDIPHDRHMVVIDLGDGDSDITGTGIPGSWHASWRLSAMSEGRAIELCTDGTQIVAL